MRWIDCRYICLTLSDAVPQVCQGRVSHFVILFYQSKTLAFKGVYASDPATGEYAALGSDFNST